MLEAKSSVSGYHAHVTRKRQDLACSCPSDAVRPTQRSYRGSSLHVATGEVGESMCVFKNIRYTPPRVSGFNEGETKIS